VEVVVAFCEWGAGGCYYGLEECGGAVAGGGEFVGAKLEVCQ
jgi:hypothetical protein